MIQLLVLLISSVLIYSLNASEHTQSDRDEIRAAFENLFEAINTGDIDGTCQKIEVLKKRNKKPSWPDRNYMPYAFDLLLKIKDNPNGAAILQCCVIAGMPIDKRASDSHTLMHTAAAYNDVPTINYLASMRLDVNAKTGAKRTPLHFAVYYNSRPEVAAALINLGADPHKKHSDNRSPYECLADWKRDDMRPAFEQAMRDKGIAFVSLLYPPHQEDPRIKLEPLDVESSSPTTDDEMGTI